MCLLSFIVSLVTVPIIYILLRMLKTEPPAYLVLSLRTCDESEGQQPAAAAGQRRALLLVLTVGYDERLVKLPAGCGVAVDFEGHKRLFELQSIEAAAPDAQQRVQLFQLRADVPADAAPSALQVPDFWHVFRQFNQTAAAEPGLSQN